MSEKMTATQHKAMRELDQSITDSVVFGYGFGSYRVALRALVHRAPHLVTREVNDLGEEQFTITDKGRAALSPTEEG